MTKAKQAITYWKVAKSNKVRGTEHNNINDAIRKMIDMGAQYRVFEWYPERGGFWMPVYIPRLKSKISKKLYAQIPKSRL